MFQVEGAPSRTPLVPPYHDYPLHHDSRVHRRSSQAVLHHDRLLLPLRVPLPVRLRGLLQLLKHLRNPPRLVGFRLALLHLVHVTTRRPVRVSRSRQLVTPLQLGWLTSFMRSALTLALSELRFRGLVWSARGCGLDAALPNVPSRCWGTGGGCC